jgi:hypothetical protein
MRAVAKSDPAAWSQAEVVLTDLTRKGVHLFQAPVEPRVAAELAAEVSAGRRFDESLFLAEPMDAPRRRLSSRLEQRLAFADRAPQVAEAFWALLGPDYRVIDRAVVCNLPAQAIPSWLQRRLYADPAIDVSAYVRPDQRDICFRHGASFRQELATEEASAARVLTLWVNLTPVADTHGGPVLLEGSHRLGRSDFPHDLKPVGPERLRYRNGVHGDLFVRPRRLAGEAGTAALAHACLLQAAEPAAAAPQFALRVRIARGEALSAGIDAVNASLAGPLAAEAPRPAPALRAETAPVIRRGWSLNAA